MDDVTAPARERIGVAFDGGAASFSALEWAALRAEDLHAVLMILGADEFGDTDAGWVAGPPHAVDRVLEDAVEWTRFNASALLVERFAVRGDAAEGLIARSGELTLLVIGSRRRGERRVLFETVARRVAALADCPVVVLPAGLAASDGPVVVGVASQELSDAPVLFAADMAATLGRPLRIMHAWWPLDMTRSDAVAVPNAHQRLLDETVAAVRAAHPALEVAAESGTEDGYETLKRAGASASMVVVGRRRRGVVAALLLGSVAHDLLGALPCPVAVVPERRRERPHR